MSAIGTNVGALNARLNAIKSNGLQERAMERLSSGLRINSAADDAAGLAVAGKMESQLRGINMAVRNAQDGVGLIQTAESGLNEIRNMVLRIRELAVQMANGIYEDTPDRANAQLEVSALLNQVTLIADNTRFNDVNLIDGSFTGITIQAGNTTAETIELSFIDVTAATLDGTAAAAVSASFDLASTSDTDVTAGGGSGSGATFTVVTDASSNITMTLTGGSGYAVGDVLTINGEDLTTDGSTAGTADEDDITFTVTGVGLEISLATVATQSDAKVAIGTMDTALQTIAGEQAKFGSLQNRLTYSISNLSRASVMTEQALGRIMDADFAEESTNLSKAQILNQAATAMLAQANQSKSQMLQLIQ